MADRSPTRRRAGGLLIALVASALAAPAFGKSRTADEEDDAETLPNLFISPSGQPFRAKADAPYPVVDWFRGADKNADGKLERAEFVADAAAFFKTLDLNGDGVLGRGEIAYYEQRVCPELLGGRIRTGEAGRMGARLWLAQAPAPAPIDPAGDQPPPEPKPPSGIDETGQGAAPFSLLDEPEPVLAADLDLDGIITRKNFLKLADLHFITLDETERGYLTLATLPKTQVQKLLGKDKPRRSHS